MDNAILYDFIYALAASNGREAILFGREWDLSRQVFERSYIGRAFPLLWFEMPLLGDPWFDLHVVTEQDKLEDDVDVSKPNLYYPHVFEWFAANKADARQLAISHDLSSGNTENPAVQLLRYRGNTNAMADFLSTASNNEDAAAFTAFEERLPNDWFACYAGVFPSRPGMGVRVECIPRLKLQQAYAKDTQLLETHLQQIGVPVADTTILSWYEALAQHPYSLEFQFNLAPDGTPEPTLGLSARLSEFMTERDADFDMNESSGQIMKQVEAWGLTDDRWHLFPSMVFSKKLAREGSSVTLNCAPGFIKIRWRDGEPLDAKVYFIATVS